MKYKKLITFVIVVLVVVAVFILIGQINKKEPLDYTYNHSSSVVNGIDTGDYSTYKQNTGQQIINPTLTQAEAESLIKKAYEYSALSGTGIAVERYNVDFENKKLEIAADGEYLFINDQGAITWTFSVPKSGFYNLQLEYVTTALQSKSSSIERKMTIIVDPASQSEFNRLANSVEFKELVSTEEYAKASVADKMTKVQTLLTTLLTVEGKVNATELAAKYTRIGFVNASYDDNMSNQSYVFSRVWKGDTGVLKEVDTDYDSKHMTLSVMPDTSGNDVKPSQVEVEYQLISSRLSDYMGYVTEPYQYYFEEGENTITLSSIKEFILLKNIGIVEVDTTPTYSEYLQNLANNGLVDQQTKTYSYRIEGEACSFTSSPTLYPITDRTSSNTYPYSVKNTKLNSIGGDSWKVLGDWIVWEFEVEEAGFYNISMRARQNLVRGMYSHRMVYIDDQIPFEELKSTVFAFSSDWQNVTLGSNEDEGSAFKFYLTPGKHTIKMEVTLGVYGELVEELENVTQDLNALYLNIIKYTTASPDTNRDYGLTKMEDLNLNARLIDAHDRLVKLSSAIARISSKNSDKEDPVGDGEIYKDGKSDKTGVIDTVVEQIELFLELSKKVTQQLGSFSTNISSLGTLLSTLREFPLTLDYLVVYSADSDYELPKANEGFFKSLWNSIAGFYYSFIIDYSEIGTTVEGNEDLENITIDVWMTLGRDQANVIRKLIDNDFNDYLADPKNNIKINGKTPGKDVHVSVNLKLTGTDVLLKAALAGVGPDVAINVDSSLPVNYGLRSATLDLAAEFGEDYWQHVNKYFLPSTIRQFTFNGSTYALPEKQNYMMMFVRTDIMEDLYGDVWESMVPQTWEDVLSIMTDLQTNSLQFYLPVNDAGANALNPAFVSMLYQNGGQLYSDDAKETGLLNNEAMDTFEYWTDFYTKYSFPKSASFINRFRSGEMPLGISYYEMYNTLAVFAPEIRGNWAFYPIPGTEITINNAEEDVYGLRNSVPEENRYPYTVVDHTSVASGTAAIMIAKNAQRDANKKYASWEFLKWWTGSIQDEFGKEMEGILGSSARHATANYDSFVQLAWPKADQEQLLKQWGYGDFNPATYDLSTHPEGQTVIDENNFYLEVKNVSVPGSAFGTSYMNKDVYSYDKVSETYYHVYGVREIPQIAGSYITGREIENAYRAVINNNYNAKETLYSYAQNINNEIDRKRSEFNLD